ncbi:hypothetical protein [Devriesea agamarum]|uniref:hypothetical protein n=1 Tax=Devriesea agamarum TaxID=472569 RepID=UPI00071D877A|nr:hypothetical protein [Devriesea agamarum]
MAEFFYNTVTGQVEEGQQSPVHQLMGPYATREDAAHAFEIAKRRNEAWEDDDRAWGDKD